MTYKEYKDRVINLLVTGKTWRDGVWKRKGKSIQKSHILPLDDDMRTSAGNKAAAIKNYLGFDCTPFFPENFDGLHRCAHHLNSSQTLCLMFFSRLISKEGYATAELVKFMKETFCIDIHEGAKCEFEYKEKIEPYLFDADMDGNLIPGYEGTSFDFHIEDNKVEIYFEIKLTEQGFKKEKDDKRHLAKANEYLRTAPKFFKELIHTPEDFLKQYQIYRNVIRANDRNKYVVFITDGNNPSTNQDKEYIESLHFPRNVIFKTWQQISSNYPYELPYQFRALVDNIND